MSAKDPLQEWQGAYDKEIIAAHTPMRVGESFDLEKEMARMCEACTSCHIRLANIEIAREMLSRIDKDPWPMGPNERQLTEEELCVAAESIRRAVDDEILKDVIAEAGEYFPCSCGCTEDVLHVSDLDIESSHWLCFNQIIKPTSFWERLRGRGVGAAETMLNVEQVKRLHEMIHKWEKNMGGIRGG